LCSVKTGARRTSDEKPFLGRQSPTNGGDVLVAKHTASSYSDIGEHFGGRNHSTVVAAEKKVRQWIEKNEELSLGQRRVRVRELVERVERELSR
jgi:hypothetical protein